MSISKVNQNLILYKFSFYITRHRLANSISMIIKSTVYPRRIRILHEHDAVLLLNGLFSIYEYFFKMILTPMSFELCKDRHYILTLSITTKDGGFSNKEPAMFGWV